MIRRRKEDAGDAIQAEGDGIYPSYLELSFHSSFFAIIPVTEASPASPPPLASNARYSSTSLHESRQLAATQRPSSALSERSDVSAASTESSQLEYPLSSTPMQGDVLQLHESSSRAYSTYPITFSGTGSSASDSF
ncbi:hypothetical protein CVT25_002907 [Psilocybe cyanescens]|uniref:Uncharacterized protein n=1 Tax=Psilocybe cyanescens TaxID=93625 RepID=A0A409X5Z7_PSICY|nr:hypothetical protein CVT25_002907 [Psilocybe cyanescens]